ncbi:diguanylate cyclase (GGDEF)-like protein [Crossiella equi]|uniref:Diguanylate cyclase (GGDEF)-like protein n=1 Tax=Crossiella equi TaxID=130796 RepID=A0ABS5A8R8_9PSEU|nr:GGDEF domain-containing protein [Crossiella equi]MBP2472105.1 diguanylate cyclase (GGDEF)-like protein [Crossiella equi]
MTAPGSAAAPEDDTCHTCGHAPGRLAVDRMTGLLDRWGWDERAPAEIAHAVAHQQSLALLAIDIDHFKRVNDTYGHLAGDAVIKAVADVVRGSTREASDLVGRYGGHGGDEFLVLLRQADPAEALTVAHRIRKGVHDLVLTAPSTDGGTARIDGLTLSVGICAKVPQPEDELTGYVLAADAALLAAKQAGRDRIRLADNSRTPQPVARHLLRGRLPVRRYGPVLVGIGSALAAFGYILLFSPPPEREVPAMAAERLAPPPAPSTETTVIVVTTVLPPPPPAPRPPARSAAPKKKTSKPAPTTTTEPKPLVDVCKIVRGIVGPIC